MNGDFIWITCLQRYRVVKGSDIKTNQSRHVRTEINLALDLDKKITTVRLDDAKFGPDLEMYLSTYQYLSVADDRTFEEKTIKAMDDTTKIN